MWRLELALVGGLFLFFWAKTDKVDSTNEVAISEQQVQNVTADFQEVECGDSHTTLVISELNLVSNASSQLIAKQ